MIIRHFDAKNGDCFFYGEEVQVKKVQVEQKEDFSQWKTTGKDFYEKLYALFANSIMDIVKWREFGTAPEFYINTKLEDCFSPHEFFVVLLKNSKSNTICVFNEKVYLMTDDGRTIQRIV